MFVIESSPPFEVTVVLSVSTKPDDGPAEAGVESLELVLSISVIGGPGMIGGISARRKLRELIQSSTGLMLSNLPALRF